MKLDVVRLPLIATFAILLAFVVGAMVWCGGVPMPDEAGGEVPSLLGNYLLQCQVAWPVTAKFFGALLLFIAGILLGRMSIRYGLYGVHTGLPILIFGFLACGLTPAVTSVPVYCAVLLFVQSLVTYCTCFRNGVYGFGAIFRGSLYLGLIPLIYTPALVLVLTVPLVGLAFRRSGRELLVGSVGLLFPFLVLSYVSWGCGEELFAPALTLWKYLLTPNNFSLFRLSLWSHVLAGALLLLCLGAAMCYTPNSYPSGSRARAILLLILLLFPLTISMLFLPCASISSVALIAVPAAIILPLFFVRVTPMVAFLFILLPLVLWGVALSH